jgi:hypothetical protein
MSGRKMSNPSDRKRKLSVAQQETADASEPARWRADIEVRGNEFLSRLALYHPEYLVRDWATPGTDAPQPIIRPTTPHHLQQTGYLA